MYYYLGALVLGCGLLYTYRYYAFLWAIWVFVKTSELYKCFNNNGNHLRFVTAEELSDNVLMYHYRGYVNHKEHELKIIRNNVRDSNEDTNEDILAEVMESLDLRNHIVHCTLLTSDDSKMIDLTSVIREFVYHFNRDDNASKMEHFLQYINSLYDLDSRGDMDDLHLVVYLNDAKFTEIKYTVKEITDQHFKDVLRIKNA